MSLKTILGKVRWIPANTLNLINMRFRGISHGGSFCSHGKILFRGKGKVCFGKNVTINSSLSSNPIGGSTRTVIFAKKDAVIHIGDNVGISNSALVSLVGITIEDNVFIGGNCKIYDHDFHSLDYNTRILPGNQGVTGKPVKIKAGAFIGGHSIILKGVTIGEKSIIGAGSVVTKSIPDGEIWAGNPARYIRKI